MFCFGKFISHLSYHICMFICLVLLLVLFSFTVDNCNIWLLPLLIFACSTLCTWYILDSFFLHQPGLVCLITSVFKLILLAKLSLRASNQLLFLILFTLNRASVPLLTFFLFSGVAFWMRTGERQTARLRLKYLQSVLKQDINFFDTEARDTNIIFHISSDAILVQDAIGDKVRKWCYAWYCSEIFWRRGYLKMHRWHS